ncbi:MAG: FAD-dependent oxidoreductase [Acidobacteria bacterium]|nr:FAD-dependent oxidoreductase [Acidobacteriota bacterium]
MEINSHKFDVVVIGGGPAGMSAALWCAEVGLSVLIVERKNELGGQLSLIHNPIRNYLGVETANGQEMKQRFVANLTCLKIETTFGVAVECIDLERKVANLSDGRSFEWGSLIFATGVRRRSLGIPGEKEFVGRGVLNSGVGEKHKAEGKTVVVVGGGDAALENSLILSDVASRVVVVHRRAQFTARQEFINAAVRRSNIEFMTGKSTISINGDDRVRGVTVHDISDHTVSAVVSDLVLVRIGVVPNSELLSGIVEMDRAGYVIVDASGASSAANVFAVGDVAHPLSPTISTAVGTGATVVKTILGKSN